MIERKIYSSWAFKKDEKEMSKINREIYEELKSKYKIYRYSNNGNNGINYDEFDLIIRRKAEYCRGEYFIEKNNTNLSDLELALICDQGNLCFGYTGSGKRFTVFED